eukprot:CAMPEP_0117427528 /NCGR_PEP_ID=MMETSP0758-20121206/7349_1 /TAXON_ID=63605 /ORGANISM="Percolomonas cosmopolitus, Strain AE-1 (ATCC 50343)" /LENGTH=323 /DNA_ID=CAMNT_0005213201 /DNA_START=1231 /DNA_END=2202 /DNA_ORIENTATION=-
MDDSTLLGFANVEEEVISRRGSIRGSIRMDKNMNLINSGIPIAKESSGSDSGTTLVTYLKNHDISEEAIGNLAKAYQFACQHDNCITKIISITQSRPPQLRYKRAKFGRLKKFVERNTIDFDTFIEWFYQMTVLKELLVDHEYFVHLDRHNVHVGENHHLMFCSYDLIESLFRVQLASTEWNEDLTMSHSKNVVKVMSNVALKYKSIVYHCHSEEKALQYFTPVMNEWNLDEFKRGLLTQVFVEGYCERLSLKSLKDMLMQLKSKDSQDDEEEPLMENDNHHAHQYAENTILSDDDEDRQVKQSFIEGPYDDDDENYEDDEII